MTQDNSEEYMEANTIPQRPARVTLALYMLYASLGISVITALVTWLWFGVPDWGGYNFLKALVQVPLFHYQVPIWVMIYGNLIILPVAVWLYYMIGKGRNWARITLLTYVILETLFYVGTVHLGLSIFPSRRLGLSAFLIRTSPEILHVILHIGAIVYLFGRVSSDWFKAIKNHNKQSMTKPKIGIPRAALGLLALLIVGVVLYQVVCVDKGEALGEAIRKNDMKQVEKLLEKGTDVNAKDKYGVPALVRAAEQGRVKIVKLLLAKGAEINARTEARGYAQPGRTALMDASWWGKYDVVKLLLDNGSDINAEDQNGETALMSASWTGKSEVVKLLLGKGASVNEKTNNGSTALMKAAARDHLAIAKLLLENGADIDAKDAKGETALRRAQTSRSQDVVKLLLDKGAGVNIENN